MNNLYTAFLKILQSVASIFNFFDKFTTSEEEEIEVKFYECLSNNCNDLENYNLTTKNVPTLRKLFKKINNALFDVSPNLTKSYYTIFDFSIEGRITCPYLQNDNCYSAVKTAIILRNVYSIISHDFITKNIDIKNGKIYYTIAKFTLNSLKSIDFEKALIENIKDDIYTLERDIYTIFDTESGNNVNINDNIGFSVKPKIIVNTFGPFVARTYEFINSIDDWKSKAIMHNPNLSFYNNNDISFNIKGELHNINNKRFYFDYDKIVFKTINEGQIINCEETTKNNLCILKNLNYKLFNPDDYGNVPLRKSSKVAFKIAGTDSYITNNITGYPLSNQIYTNLFPAFPVDIMLFNKILPALIFTRSKTYSNSNDDYTFYGSLLLYSGEAHFSHEHTLGSFTKKILLEDYEERNKKHYTSVELNLSNIFLTKIAQKILFRKNNVNYMYYLPIYVSSDNEQRFTAFYCGFYGTNEATNKEQFIARHENLLELGFLNNNSQGDYIYTSFSIEPNNFIELWTLYNVSNNNELQATNIIQFENQNYYYAFILIINSIPIIYMPFLKQNNNYFENVISEPENYNTIKSKFNSLKFYVPIYYNGYTLPKNRYVKLLGKRNYYANMFFAVGFEFFKEINVNNKRYLIPVNISKEKQNNNSNNAITQKYINYLNNNEDIENYINLLNDNGYNFIDKAGLRLIIEHYDKKYPVFNGKFDNPSQNSDLEFIFSPGIRMNLEFKNPLRYKTFEALIEKLNI